jgi:hypothetical protein
MLRLLRRARAWFCISSVCYLFWIWSLATLIFSLCPRPPEVDWEELFKGCCCWFGGTSDCPRLIFKFLTWILSSCCCMTLSAWVGPRYSWRDDYYSCWCCKDIRFYWLSKELLRFASLFLIKSTLLVWVRELPRLVIDDPPGLLSYLFEGRAPKVNWTVWFRFSYAGRSEKPSIIMICGLWYWVGLTLPVRRLKDLMSLKYLSPKFSV